MSAAAVARSGVRTRKSSASSRSGTTRRGAKASPDAIPSGSRTRGAAAGKQTAANFSRQRKVFVFGGLVAVMTITGVLLLVMQPAPLSPDAVRSLMAVETSAQVDELFNTQIPVSGGRWKYIYVHHSGASSGNASIVADAANASGSLPDHFVIGNGQGAGDGEVQIGQRWNLQQPAGKTAGLDRVDSDCISICLVGNLDRAPATPRQLEQLQRLVTALQDRLNVTRDRVWLLEATDLPAGCGRYFPQEAFRVALLP